MQQLKGILPERVLSKISVNENTGCWEFSGDPSSNGYMRVRLYGHRHMMHKVTFEFVTGKAIPKGKQLDHLCENRICCNPKHLEIVTPKINCKRKFRRRKKV